MKTTLLFPPFGPDFEAIIPDLYTGIGLQIKQSQPYATDYLVAGFLLQDTNGQLLGRAALYNNPALFLEGRKVITLGAYECVDDPFACRTLLDTALAYVHIHFPHTVIAGPMDGSTWQTYRYVTEGYELNPFLFEPYAKSYYPKQWQQAGFSTLMEYVSNLAHINESHRRDHQPEQDRYEKAGLVFRNLDVKNPEEELCRMAKFNGSAFQSAFLFSAISEADFVEKNRKLMGFLSPDMVHVVLDGNDICGMILAYPDKLDPSGKTAVVKTLARLSGDRYRGLGDLLCVKIVGTLLDQGYEKMIHALMRTENASVLNSSRFWGEPYKKYALFSYIDP